MNSQVVLTPSSLLDILQQIEELQDYDINLTESSDGNISFSIGGSQYRIDPSSYVDVEADDEVIDDVSDTNDDGYEVAGSDMYSDIESGIITELARTLLVGGMVRLTNKILRK